MKKLVKPNKRTSFIESRYIFSFALRFLGIALAGFLLLGAILYSVLNRRLGVNYSQDIGTLSNLQEKLEIILFATGILQVVILSLVFVFIALFWAHKIAGPVVRIRRYLSMLGREDLMDDMTFRQDDQLHNLAQIFRKTQSSCKICKRQLLDYFKEADQIIQEYEDLEGQKGVNLVELEQKVLALKAVYEKIREFVRRGNTI